MTFQFARSETARKRTPLYGLHIEMGARIGPFAGYDMPIQYPLGVMKEHLHTRAAAGLFDVSHMGQIAVPVGNSHSYILVVQPAQNWHGQRVTDGLDGAGDRCILVQ